MDRLRRRRVSVAAFLGRHAHPQRSRLQEWCVRTHPIGGEVVAMAVTLFDAFSPNGTVPTQTTSPKDSTMFKTYAFRAAAVAGAALLTVGALSGSASASTSSSYVGYGHVTSGTPVWCVQHLVNDYRRAAGERQISEDNVWGQETYTAVKEFQSISSLQVDGVVGPQTGNKLLNFDWTDKYAHTGYCYGYVPTTW
ncbi:peptidoglycan-binding protein [Streptomyces sp. NPDC008163]|uniref:peptidoglycan-binding domain-containing protein n=1 Tax=Streptomyces sp. NPDC008163 TaxID=3364818 RepID=UPI0036E2195F